MYKRQTLQLMLDNSLVEPKSIIRLADNATIPFDPANTDYQKYLAWVAEGNVAEEWNPNGN